MKKPDKQTMKHVTPPQEIRALRQEQMRRCSGGWNIPEGTASPSC
jgi:hypothetical protein